MLLERKPELENRLSGKIVLLTGGGGGIGLEAARAFAHMGAVVIIADIDEEKGVSAQDAINKAYASKPTIYYKVDLSSERQIEEMTGYIQREYGCPNIVFNNATIAVIGAVEEVDIATWDKSYAVNFKAPLMLAHAFLPAMKKRNSGTIVFVSSSGASPYMGAYEVFKTTQVELSNTLAMDLEDSAVRTFTIGPGLVKTDTAVKAIEAISSKMGMSHNEFYAMNSQHIIDAESAGAGFALSVLRAQAYHGQEIGAVQVLTDFGLTEKADEQKTALGVEHIEQIKESLYSIRATFEEQYSGWNAMNIFEKQWVLRDFKKMMGLSAPQVGETIRGICEHADAGSFEDLSAQKAFFERLKDYWKHQIKLLQSYEKNPEKKQQNTCIIEGWIADIEQLLCCL